MINKLNLKELIDNNAEEIVVKGSYNDVHFKLIQSAIKTQIEDGVLKTVQEVGFDVDPKELYQVLICSNCNAAFKTSKGLIYPFCPFCGGKAKLIINMQSFEPYAMVRCENCSAKTKNIIQSVDYCAVDEAVKLWNLRMSRDNNEKG